LLLKAIRRLPDREQDAVLAYALDRALVSEPVSGARTEVRPSPSMPVGFPGARIEWSSAPWDLWSASLVLRRLADGVTADQLASELGLEPDVLRAALRDMAKRAYVSKRLGAVFGQLAEGHSIEQAAGALGLSERQIAAELEPTEESARGLCAALMARAALPTAPSGSPGPRASGPLRTMPVRFPEQQYQRLKDWCEANNFPMAVVVRGVVERFLDEQQGRAA
jgi:hypothetical protein